MSTGTGKRIGIVTGTFDPVQAGHIALAQAAAGAAQLDIVYLVPEAQPRRKTGVTHIAHRVAMLRLATAPHPQLAVLEMPDKCFSVAQTVPRLRQLFPGDELVYICGSDMLEHMHQWKLVDSLFRHMALVVAARGKHSLSKVKALVAKLPSPPHELFVVPAPLPHHSSSWVRAQLAAGTVPPEVLPSTREYISRNWLYSVTDSLTSSS